MNDHGDTVERAFPELASIEDDALREGVRTAWTIAMADNDIDDLDALEWFPPSQRDLDLTDERLVPHVRDVTRGAVAMTEILQERPTVDISLDMLIAGALVHDLGKLYEFDGMEPTEIGTLLGHPYFGIVAVAKAGLPTHLAHIVLSHTHRTSVEPATLEAAIISRIDGAAAAGIRSRAVSDLRDA